MSHMKVNRSSISLDDLIINCPDCNQPLLIREGHVPRHHDRWRNHIEINALCLGPCQKYKHFILELGGVHDRRNPLYRLPVQGPAPERIVEVARIGIVHPKCKRMLSEVEFSSLPEYVLIKGNCKYCRADDVILTYSSSGSSDLNLDNFAVVCPDCLYKVTLASLEARTSSDGKSLEGIGRCSITCGTRRFVLTLAHGSESELLV